MPKTLWFFVFVLLYALPVQAKDYIYRSFTVNESSHSPGKLEPGFEINEILINSKKSLIYSNGLGTEYRIQNFDGDINCLVSGLLNFCLPQGFKGERQSWSVGKLIFKNKGRFQAGFLDNSIYFVISVESESMNKSNIVPVEFFYSIKRGVLGFIQLRQSVGGGALVYWVNDEMKAIKLD
ncbi:hypothetical protein EDC28_1042 [Gallaecimonas pentaromativorans]|uniref:Uncharacterized protein n=2 Tax=Gallaecimonas pentaromativorans TaxID=584787 RepID=A0A3N1PFB3_9GAMM|nr:hypothetical protein EDC28_1042 [Gallaecimonas pentaromativorans]